VYYARHRVVMGTLCSHQPAPVGFEGTGAVTRVQVLRDEEILHFYKQHLFDGGFSCVENRRSAVVD
jgi:hypothetical protein